MRLLGPRTIYWWIIDIGRGKKGVDGRCLGRKGGGEWERERGGCWGIGKSFTRPAMRVHKDVRKKGNYSTGT